MTKRVLTTSEIRDLDDATLVAFTSYYKLTKDSNKSDRRVWADLDTELCDRGNSANFSNSVEFQQIGSCQDY